MTTGRLVLDSGHRRRFSFADVVVDICSEMSGDYQLRLPDTYPPFESEQSRADQVVSVSLGSENRGEKSTTVYESRLNWRLTSYPRGRLCFDVYYPPMSRTFCRAVADESFENVDVEFVEDVLEVLDKRDGRAPGRPLWLPYPLAQLLMVPALSRRDGFLVHACGAVFEGKAFVFAGHSGDGKTTLAKMVASSGVELLSDERIAIRDGAEGLRAYGTPWPGEGKVFSPASYPLGGVFLLRKASEHRIREGRTSLLATELMARSIVPYYLPEETERIVAVIERVGSRVPLRELSFSKGDGLVQLLTDFARD